MGDGKTKEIKVGQWRIGFQCAQGKLVSPQIVASFFFRGHDALGPPGVMVVDNAVENFLSEIGHADLVEIGKGQGQMQGKSFGIFQADTIFNTRKMARTSYERQDFSHGSLVVSGFVACELRS